MKKILILPLFLSVFLSCGPSRHAVQVEMRYPSKAGIDLVGKNVSIVYLSNGDKTSDDFSCHMADGFAYALEDEYGTGEGSVPVYVMEREDGLDYSSRDVMCDILMDTGGDVVFLLDTVSLGQMKVEGMTRVSSPVSADSSYLSIGNMPFKMKMFSFDAMDKTESVKKYGGSSSAEPIVYSDGKDSSSELFLKAMAALPDAAWEVGNEIAGSFRSQWKHEQYSLAYFDTETWYSALDKAEEYDWKGAMDIWMSLLDTKDMLKRSCAEYNISVACYMLGNYELASEWLDRSDKDNLLPFSEAMHKRIDARK